MSSDDIDDYLGGLHGPERQTLEQLRRDILAVVPDAEEVIAYGAPAFKLHGKTVAGFAAYKHHLSYLPHSGSVLGRLGDEVAGYKTSKGALKFPMDTALPAELVGKLVATRLAELGIEAP